VHQQVKKASKGNIWT